MVSLWQEKRQHTRRKSYMQQVNPSHERQKSTRDKTERNLEKIGQILVIVCLFTEHLRQERIYRKYIDTLLGMIQSVFIHKNSVFSENSSFFWRDTLTKCVRLLLACFDMLRSQNHDVDFKRFWIKFFCFLRGAVARWCHVAAPHHHDDQDPGQHGDNVALSTCWASIHFAATSFEPNSTKANPLEAPIPQWWQS